MGKIYAERIHDYVTKGINTKYRSLADVPVKYKAATRATYEEVYGRPVPEAD